MPNDFSHVFTIMSALGTTSLLALLARHRAGDAAALDELVRRCHDRLEAMARRMLSRFPAVRRAEEADDVLQSALIRLERALREVQLASTRDFFALAAEQIRRELLDLARYHLRRGGAAGALPLGRSGDSSDAGI